MFAGASRRLFLFLMLLVIITLLTSALSLESTAQSAYAAGAPNAQEEGEQPDPPQAPAASLGSDFFSQGNQPSGLIAIHAPSGPMISTTTSSWEDIPHMRGRVSIRDTSTIAVSFCAETRVTNGKRLFVRLLLNGVPAEPSDVMFSLQDLLDTNCFTFVKENAQPDLYTVGLQWSTDSGGTAYLGDRTMTITFATADAPEMRLLAHAAPSGSDLPHTGGWADIPHMQGEITMPSSGDLAITFSAEADTTNGKRMFVRALVDGEAATPSDQIMTLYKQQGARTVTFSKKSVGAGKHSIKLQRFVDDGGEGYIGDRTLTAMGVPNDASRQTAALFLEGISSAYITTPTSGQWYDVPGLSGTINTAAEGDLVVHFNGFIFADNGTGVGMRAVVDGKAASPSDILLTSDMAKAAYGYNFVARNIKRGTHSVKLQWWANGLGKAYVGDRIMTAYQTAEQIPVLFVAMESERGEEGYIYGGKFASKVVDERPGLRVFRPYVRERLMGEAPSVADYFREVSGDRHFLANAGVFGPWLKKYNEKYYREKISSPFTKMKQEAIEKVDPFFDFSLYDHDGDGVVRRDELQVTVILYQDWGFGELRIIPDYATDDGVTLSGEWITTVYTPDFDRPMDIGFFAHELAHATIQALDEYDDPKDPDPTAPGPFSLMDDVWTYPHLDPMNRLYAADWFDAQVVTRDGYYVVPAVEKEPVIYKLLDPNSHHGEYFLVENRQRIGYDSLMPDDGLAIYHIDENVPGAGGGFNDYYGLALEIEPASGLAIPIVYNGYLWDGAGMKWGREFTNKSAVIDSRWKNGADSQIGVYMIDQSAEKMRVYFDVPGPGILVDAFPDVATTAGSAVFEIRLINTGQKQDTFVLSTKLPSQWTTFSQDKVTLNPYEERIVTLTVAPEWGSSKQFDTVVVAQSLTDLWTNMQQPISIRKDTTYSYRFHIPVVIR